MSDDYLNPVERAEMLIDASEMAKERRHEENLQRYREALEAGEAHQQATEARINELAERDIAVHVRIAEALERIADALETERREHKPVRTPPPVRSC